MRGPSLVTAPAVPVATSTPPAEAETVAAGGPVSPGANAAPPSGMPAACDRPWNLDVVGGDGRVVVVCAHDVRRRPIDESAAIARALEPGLDPAREKICACVARLKAPPFVDLLFTAQPEEGRVTVQAGGDDDLDPEFGPPFVACIGTVVATFAPLKSDTCAEPGKVAFIYPVRLELAP
ncbi:MAG: hypothetical protein JOZ69_06620 [Myxococcales bacterium]|nr:hypothetical protein [Myxococcales bacterium]